MTHDLKDAKSKLRQQAHLQRSRMAAGDRTKAATAAMQHFFDGVEIGAGQIVAAYWPIRDEIDCKPLLTRLMDAQQPVCLPAVMGADVPLQFRRWESGAPLYESGFGTLGPLAEAPVDEPDIIIIPLLGFDAEGTRLGYGKGHYDRTIAVMNKTPVLVGYAFAAQELTDIPREAHDIPLDYLVTENGVKRFSN